MLSNVTIISFCVYLLVCLFIMGFLGLIPSWLNFVLVCMYAFPLFFVVHWIVKKVYKEEEIKENE